MGRFALGCVMAGYLGLVYFSLPLVFAMSQKLGETHAGLVDTRWKRAIWLLSSFFFVPYLLLVPGPAFVAGEIRWFLSGQVKEK